MGLAAPRTHQPFHIWDNNKLFQIQSVTGMKWDLWGSFSVSLVPKKQIIQYGFEDSSWIVDHSNWQFCFRERRNVKFWYGWSDFIHCLVTVTVLILSYVFLQRKCFTIDWKLKSTLCFSRRFIFKLSYTNMCFLFKLPLGCWDDNCWLR